MTYMKFKTTFAYINNCCLKHSIKQYGNLSNHNRKIYTCNIRVDTKMMKDSRFKIQDSWNETSKNIYLDVSKAFDTLDHNILTNTYGIK